MASNVPYTIGTETPWAVNVQILPSVSAADDGTWFDTLNFDEGSIDVSIATTATVVVCGSNAAAVPANSAHGFQIGGDISATGAYIIVDCPRWLKTRVSAWTAGAVIVNATLRRASR